MINNNINKRKSLIKQTTVSLVVVWFVLAICNTTHLNLTVEARASLPVSTPTTTTNQPTSYIEDSLNAATSESSDDSDACQLRCFEQVQTFQGLFRVHKALIKEQKKLVQKFKSASTTTPIPNTTTRKPKQQQSSNSTLIRNRTLNENMENAPIIVSRLRVARSPTQTYANNNNNNQEMDNNAKSGQAKKKFDSTLKQLKHKQKEQFNETCKSLHEMHQCLERISHECIGDLQFHSLEVFADQWSGKLNCPPSNNPSFKPFAALTRSIPEIEEREKVPMARPISSPEETQKKLDAIFGDGSRPPLGVMLKPSLTRSASQKFNLMSEQRFDSSDVDANGQLKARNIFSGNEINHNNSKQSYLVPIAGQLLLIPSFLLLLIALLAITNRYFKQPTK